MSNGEQSLDFTCYEQTTNHFWSPHLAESRVKLYTQIFVITHIIALRIAEKEIINQNGITLLGLPLIT